MKDFEPKPNQAIAFAEHLVAGGIAYGDQIEKAEVYRWLHVPAELFSDKDEPEVAAAKERNVLIGKWKIYMLDNHLLRIERQGDCYVVLRPKQVQQLAPARLQSKISDTLTYYENMITKVNPDDMDDEDRKFQAATQRQIHAIGADVLRAKQRFPTPRPLQIDDGDVAENDDSNEDDDAA